MPPATHRASAATTAPLERVWTELQDPGTWASIGGAERAYDATHDAAGNLSSYRFEAIVAGKAYPGTARTTVAEQPELMTVAIDSKDLTGTITVQLASRESATHIEVSAEFTPKGFLASLMFGAISGAIASGMLVRAERLAARCEES